MYQLRGTGKLKMRLKGDLEKMKNLKYLGSTVSGNVEIEVGASHELSE